MRTLSLCLLLAIVVLGVGCQAKKQFTVSSYPSGAILYVDDERHGEKTVVEIDFSKKPYQTIRVEKEGYQPAGALVSRSSPGALSFVLERVPDFTDIKRILSNIDRNTKK